MADQAHRLEPKQVRLILEGISVREYDSAFCANARNSGGMFGGIEQYIVHTPKGAYPSFIPWSFPRLRYILGRARIVAVSLLQGLRTWSDNG